MSCCCENKERATLKKARELAHIAVKLENKTYVIVENKDGTYQFLPLGHQGNKKIIEYITI